MVVQIGAKPDSGFDDPLGMLGDCHRRIERFLGVLCMVAERAGGRGLTEEETAAVQSALSYFRLGGARHTADEEESLFPRLRAAGGFAEPEEPEELDRLERDHAEAIHLHREADRLFQAWITAGLLEEEDERRLRSSTDRLRGIYQPHIRTEDTVVFPRARGVLDKDAIRAMGEEFRLRRQ